MKRAFVVTCGIAVGVATLFAQPVDPLSNTQAQPGRSAYAQDAPYALRDRDDGVPTSFGSAFTPSRSIRFTGCRSNLKISNLAKGPFTGVIVLMTDRGGSPPTGPSGVALCEIPSPVALPAVDGTQYVEFAIKNGPILKPGVTYWMVMQNRDGPPARRATFNVSHVVPELPSKTPLGTYYFDMTNTTGDPLIPDHWHSSTAAIEITAVPVK